MGSGALRCVDPRHVTNKWRMHLPSPSLHAPSSSMHSDRKALLARSWDSAARMYTCELAPRFLPWIRDAVEVLRAERRLTQGSVLVPCCGPGGVAGALSQAPHRAWIRGEPEQAADTSLLRAVFN